VASGVEQLWHDNTCSARNTSIDRDAGPAGRVPAELSVPIVHNSVLSCT
jgi:hypothetical protein